MSAGESQPTSLQSEPPIWELLPPRTRLVLLDAIRCADGRSAVEPHHLLLALLRAPRSGAAFLLAHAQVNTGRLQQATDGIESAADGPVTCDGIAFSPHLVQILSEARAFSVSLRRPYISTSHLLMALAASDLPVGQLMRQNGLTPAKLRRSWRKWQRESNLRRRWALGLEAASVFRPVMPKIPSFKSAAALAGIPWKVLARKSLLNPGYRTDPYRMYRFLRRERPFALDPLLPAFVAVDYQDVQSIIKDPRFGRAPFIADGFPPAVRRQVGAPESHRGLPAMMLFADPPRHTRIRAAFMRVFNSVPMEAIRRRLVGTIDSLLSRMADMEQFDVIAEFSGPLPTAVITTLMGLPEGDTPQLASWSDRMVPAIGIHSSLDDLAQADAAYDEFSNYLRQKLSASRREGMLGALLDGDAAELPQEEFIANCMLLLMAGHETTTSLITNGIVLLLTHPEQRRIALQDDRSMAAAVEEILRFESPVQWTGRVAVTDVSIRGKTVHRGDLVLAGIGAANRDPAVFTEPDVFNVRRTENRHIAFGFGIHYCLGAMLAKMEAQIALTEFFRWFPHAALAQKSHRWRPGLVLRCPEQLLIRRNRG